MDYSTTHKRNFNSFQNANILECGPYFKLALIEYIFITRCTKAHVVYTVK